MKLPTTIETADGLFREAKRIAAGGGMEYPPILRRAILGTALDLGAELVEVGDRASDVARAVDGLAADGVYLAHLADLAEPVGDLRAALVRVAARRWGGAELVGEEGAEP